MPSSIKWRQTSGGLSVPSVTYSGAMNGTHIFTPGAVATFNVAGTYTFVFSRQMTLGGLFIAGGGGAGSGVYWAEYDSHHNGGGGGAGGFWESWGLVVSGTITVYVGAGGTGATAPGAGNAQPGGLTQLGPWTVYGGGLGGSGAIAAGQDGGNGDSGGGGGAGGYQQGGAAGVGRAGFGYNGFTGQNNVGGSAAGGGGGGAGNSAYSQQHGGPGRTSTIFGGTYCGGGAALGGTHGNAGGGHHGDGGNAGSDTGGAGVRGLLQLVLNE
jgi:hypothetical protein